jgi:hypothetical protein
MPRGDAPALGQLELARKRQPDSACGVQAITNVSISYANALVDLAKETDLLDAVHTDVDGLQVSLDAFTNV